MVTVKLFGTLRTDTGVKAFTAEAESVRALLPLAAAALRARAPGCPVTEAALRGCLVTVNGEQATLRTKLHDGDAVCLFPPVAGG